MAFLSFGVSWPYEESYLNIVFSQFFLCWPHDLFSLPHIYLLLFFPFSLLFLYQLNVFTVTFQFTNLLFGYIQPAIKAIFWVFCFIIVLYTSRISILFIFIDLSSFVNSPFCHLFSWTHYLQLFWSPYLIQYLDLFVWCFLLSPPALFFLYASWFFKSDVGHWV